MNFNEAMYAVAGGFKIGHIKHQNWHCQSDNSSYLTSTEWNHITRTGKTEYCRGEPLALAFSGAHLGEVWFIV